LPLKKVFVPDKDKSYYESEIVRMKTEITTLTTTITTITTKITETQTQIDETTEEISKAKECETNEMGVVCALDADFKRYKDDYTNRVNEVVTECNNPSATLLLKAIVFDENWSIDRFLANSKNELNRYLSAIPNWPGDDSSFVSSSNSQTSQTSISVTTKTETHTESSESSSESSGQASGQASGYKATGLSSGYKASGQSSGYSASGNSGYSASGNSGYSASGNSGYSGIEDSQSSGVKSSYSKKSASGLSLNSRSYNSAPIETNFAEKKANKKDIRNKRLRKRFFR